MRHAVFAIVLWIVSGVAGAQCTTPAQAATPTVHRGGELIRTAGAAMTRNETSVTKRPAPTAADDKSSSQDHRGMLLAALALMSGIALRRFGARDQ